MPELWHSAKSFFFKKNIRRRRPSADGVKSLPRNLALGKAAFTEREFDGGSLLSVALGKGFAECKAAFAECNRHSAKSPPPVVDAMLTVFGRLYEKSVYDTR